MGASRGRDTGVLFGDFSNDWVLEPEKITSGWLSVYVNCFLSFGRKYAKDILD